MYVTVVNVSDAIMNGYNGFRETMNELMHYPREL